MAKKQSSQILNLVTWFTGVVVSLAVAFGMINGSLTVPILNQEIGRASCRERV